MTIDFLERLVGFLNEQGYYALVVSPLLTDGRSIAVMTMPGGDYEYYFDGSYRQGYAFQVATKHESQLEGYQTLLSITSLLDGDPDIPSSNGSYQLEGIDIITSPNVITKDDKYYIHAAQFSAALFIEEGNENG